MDEFSQATIQSFHFGWLLCLTVHIKGKSIMRSLDSVHSCVVVAKTQTHLDLSLTLYLRMKLKKPVLGMFTVN